MDFDKSRVYTAVNADELKVGSKVILADTLEKLKVAVNGNYITNLVNIRSSSHKERFEGEVCDFSLCYLVSEPEEKKLKWTDLKLGDVIRNKELPFIKHLITGIDEDAGQVFFCDSWTKSNELEEWEKVE